MTMYRFDTDARAKGRTSFLELVWATNDAAQAAGESPIFGRPVIETDGEGRTVERYEEATIMFRLPGNDDGVRVIANSERAIQRMTEGAAALGL